VNVDADSEKCSIAVLDAEQNPPGANITTFGDALWWACETVTTVGYGDRYPVTPDGRAIAVADGRGISMVMAITAAVPGWMVRQVELKGRDEEAVDD
jgi:voltage-gated potassium channel